MRAGIPFPPIPATARIGEVALLSLGTVNSAVNSTTVNVYTLLRANVY